MQWLDELARAAVCLGADVCVPRRVHVGVRLGALRCAKECMNSSHLVDYYDTPPPYRHVAS